MALDYIQRNDGTRVTTDTHDPGTGTQHCQVEKVAYGATDAVPTLVAEATPMPVAQAGSTWTNFTPVAVADTATSILAAQTDRKEYRVYNDSDVTIFLGASAVTTANGCPLEPGQWWVDAAYRGQVFAIRATVAGTKNVRLREIRA